MYTPIEIKGKEYQLRMSASAIVNCEKRLGENPLNLFMQAGEGKLPKLSDMLIIFHCALEEMQHGLTMNDVYNIFDEYCEDGKSLTDLIADLLRVFQDSGLVPKDANGKNSKRK